MKTFKILADDLVFDGQNNLAMVEKEDEEVQSIERILTTNINEWFLNIGHGLNYSETQGKGRTEETIRLAVIEAISQEERVVDIEYINISINRSTRTLNISFKCSTSTGNYIEGGEVLELE